MEQFVPEICDCLYTRNVQVAVLSKTIHFARTVSTSMLEMLLVDSLVSVLGDVFHNIPPASTEAAVFGSFGNAGMGYLRSSQSQTSKTEKLVFERLSSGSNC